MRNVFIVASNGRYNVLKKGELYTVIKAGEPLTSVKKWKDRRLLSSMLIKGGYDLIDPHEPYYVIL
jgi:hypothetical protein